VAQHICVFNDDQVRFVPFKGGASAFTVLVFVVLFQVSEVRLRGAHGVTTERMLVEEPPRAHDILSRFLFHTKFFRRHRRTPLRGDATREGLVSKETVVGQKGAKLFTVEIVVNARRDDAVHRAPVEEVHTRGLELTNVRLRRGGLVVVRPENVAEVSERGGRHRY